MRMSKVSPSFEDKARVPIMASGIGVLQVNVGYRCNLQCRHCHVQAGPERSEVMPDRVMEQCLEVVRSQDIPVVDITGGSPELHPGLRPFLQACAALGRRVLVRSNGVVLLEKRYEPFIDLYAATGIEVVLSLPHVDPRLTERQRGEGVFTGLIGVIARLNALGYGREGSGLVLDLVHNPAGAYLPGSQAGLEALFRQVLAERHGVSFNHLFCITNMPIGRYLEYLLASGNYEDYMKSLIAAFNPASLSGVMCKSTVSVGWDGSLYDCDFNQVLGLTINHGAPYHISDFDTGALAARRIVVGDHCYGCTAGAGSSCQGQTA